MIKFLFTILKYGLPLLVVSLPSLVIVGMVSPWPVAQVALAQDSTRGTLLIGWSYNYHASGASSHEKREQTYAVIPTLKTVTVIQEDGKVRTEEAPNGLVSAIAGYVCVLFGTWWFGLRRKPVETAGPGASKTS